MKENDLLEQIQNMAPWHHRIQLQNGIFTEAKKNTDSTTEVVSALDPHRVFNFATRRLLPNGMEGRSFLDCACNCGGYSFAAKDAGASRTYGFDVREHWIDQAKFIAKHREADSTEMTFEVADLMQIGAGEQEFDVTWFSGIFYHLPDPVTGLKYAADRTKELLFLNTSCSLYVDGVPEAPALHYKREGVEQLMSGVHGLSWLPSGPQVLKDILSWLGFPEAKTYMWLSNPPQTGKGQPMARVGIVAARETGRLDAMTDLSRPTDLQQEAKAVKQPPSVVQEAALVSQVDAEQRPERWEDDISVNALDAASFENLPAISEWDVSAFKAIPNGTAPQNIRSLPLSDLIAKDTLPIPQARDRENYNLGMDEEYWLSGLSDYHKVLSAADAKKVEVNRILDIGCASGRFLRHFACQRETPEIWGSDVNGRHIRWLTEYMPSNVRPVFVPALPSMPFEDNYFDVVTAFSVFTHLDTFESAFLSEIRRVLRPGGLAYLTVHTEPTWEAWGKGASDPNSHISGKIARYPNLKEDLMHPMTRDVQTYRWTETGPYRSLAFHSTDHIKSSWGRFLQIEDIIPKHHNFQTCVLARA
ncbi:class I SAM-dependent methyltransferase [Planktotalea sp.]|uniref:class I SAM-dependent methyltransferase n=1 Tax=Planktotalea sp. TaxID=2029877 RepID=UPI0032969543